MYEKVDKLDDIGRYCDDRMSLVGSHLCWHGRHGSLSVVVFLAQSPVRHALRCIRRKKYQTTLDTPPYHGRIILSRRMAIF